MKQQKQNRDAVLQTDGEITENVYGDLAKEEELALYKKQRARELLQLQSEAFFRNQKKWI